jgi:phospholipid/cholesterol/gamma-HCH transport system substrate-binding protein
MTTQTRDAFVGVVYLVVLALLATLAVMVFNKDFVSVTKVSLYTDDVGSSLQQGSDVEVRGVHVGEVRKIRTNGTGAILDLALDPGKAKSLPDNMIAQLLPKTVFGQRYVSLVFPANPSPTHLKSGDHLQQDTSTRAVELEQIFQHLLPVLQAVEPDKLNASLSAIADALRGRGETIATTMKIVGSYLTQFSPHVPAVTEDLDALASVATTYNAAVPDLLNALNSLTVTSKTIVAQSQQLQALFASVTGASDVVNGFLTANQQQLIALSVNSLPTLQVLAQYSGEFPCISRTLVNYIPIADKAFGVGTAEPGLHVVLHVVPNLGKYTPADRPTAGGPVRGPSCPFTSAAALQGTAVSAVAQSAAHAPAGSSSTNLATAASTGLGPANSRGENQLIAELMAPTIGVRPSDFPAWSSLLLGPVLRGTVVELK